MAGLLNNFWNWVSNFGIPAGISPDERKVHVSANQLMMVTLILIAIMSLSLLVAWLMLLQIDFVFYRYYFLGGAPPVLSLVIGTGIYIYRGKSGRFYGPIVAFAYLMSLLIASLTVIFGGIYGLEYWVLVVMGIGVFVLHKRKFLRRSGVATSMAVFISLRIWTYYMPPYLPVLHEGTRIFYIEAARQIAEATSKSNVSAKTDGRFR